MGTDNHDPEQWLQPERGPLKELMLLIENSDGKFKLMPNLKEDWRRVSAMNNF